MGVRTPWLFFALLLVLSVPFFFIGRRSLLPEGMPFFSATALMAFLPLIIATALAWRQQGAKAAVAPLKAAFAVTKVHPLWWATAFLILPMSMYLAYHLSNLLGAGLPPMAHPWNAPLATLGMFLLLYLFAVGEEVGWMAYASHPLAARWDVLGAALIIGLMGAAWHLVPYLKADHTTSWVFWQCVVTVLQRPIIFWLYLNPRGGLVAAATFHAMFNVSYRMFPGDGALYDPFTTALVLTAVVALIVLLWGPNLSRFRFAAPARAG